MSTPRPRSVTLGCVYGGLGGVLSTVVLFESLQNWGSIEMQETLRTSLSQVGADTDLDAVLPMLRWVVMALMVAAIAATVFAFYAAKGHQSSRIGLTVLAGLAGVSFILSGVVGVLPAVLAGLIVYLLWSKPAREWFAVMNGRTPLSLGATPSVPDTTTTVAPHRADQRTHAPQPAHDPSQHVEHASYPAPAQYAEHADRPVSRPRSVTIALVVAGVGSAVGAGLSALVLLALVVMRDQVIAQYADNDLLSRQLDAAGLTPDQMVTLGTWLFGVWLVASVLGLLATGWAATGQGSGWWALVLVTLLMSGCGAFGLPLGLLWIVGGIVVIVQLAKPESKAWFRSA